MKEYFKEQLKKCEPIKVSDIAKRDSIFGRDFADGDIMLFAVFRIDSELGDSYWKIESFAECELGRLDKEWEFDSQTSALPRFKARVGFGRKI